MFVCMYVCMYVCMKYGNEQDLSICMYVCLYILIPWIHTHIHIYTYIHSYIHTYGCTFINRSMVSFFPQVTGLFSKPSHNACLLQDWLGRTGTTCALAHSHTYIHTYILCKMFFPTRFDETCTVTEPVGRAGKQSKYTYIHTYYTVPYIHTYLLYRIRYHTYILLFFE